MTKIHVRPFCCSVDRQIEFKSKRTKRNNYRKREMLYSGEFIKIKSKDKTKELKIILMSTFSVSKLDQDIQKANGVSKMHG